MQLFSRSNLFFILKGLAMYIYSPHEIKMATNLRTAVLDWIKLKLKSMAGKSYGKFAVWIHDFVLFIWKKSWTIYRCDEQRICA